MSRGQILLIPAYEHGRGGGHLCRCMKLALDLRITGREAWVFLPEQAPDMNSLFRSMNFDIAWRITEDDLPRILAADTECIVLDRFQTPCGEFSRWKEIAPVVGIDEGGPCRDGFDFLVDILVPQKMAAPLANVADPSLLQLPEKPLLKKRPANGDMKILVSFGHEDTAGLGSAVTRTLSEALSAMNLPNVEITYLRGARAKDDNAASLLKVNVLQTIPRLAETISEYGLVLTHYGITAYEALYAGTPVLLLPPTAYHKKLAKAAGFCSVKGVNRIFRGNFLQKLEKTCKTLAVKYGLDKEGTNLAALVSGFSPQVNRRCPVCGEAPGRSVSRFPERTYRRCPRCGVIYMDRTCPPPIEYEREYFFESYRRQYGKTYIEDFPNIKAAGKRRLKIIKSLLPAGERRSLLDIGCAYGPFLAAASEEGFSPAGIDPAEDAVRYVQQNLAVPAVHGFFPDSPLPVPAPYDVITLWYVIEHFSDCAAALAEIRNILKPGGILAFSTPSFSGVSGRTSLRRFLDASPADHRTIWSPKMCRKALVLAGFKVKKIVISGHHGERFPLLGKFAKSKKSPLYRPLLAASKIFALGDTFEVYAQALPKKERV